MNITEKAAHLKGLIEGMNYDRNSNEGKLFTAITDLLEDLTLTVKDLEDDTAALGNYIDEIDEDLGEIESFVYDIDDEYDDDYDDDYDEDCCCDDDSVELTCPSCGEKVYIDEMEIDELNSIKCPSCNKLLNIVKGEEDKAEEESK